MADFFALVDATPGFERQVGDALRAMPTLRGVEACRDGNFDFLIRFDAPDFHVVDDFLQTHIRRIPGVKGVEIIVDWDSHSPVAREARDRILSPPPAPKLRAVVLLSGGLDSTVAAAIALEQGFEVHALSFNYDQRHKRELQSAVAVAKALDVASHAILHVPVGQLGGSALTANEISIPTHRSEAAMGGDIPVTYVPARNIVFLSLGLGLAEVKDADAIFIGANALDYSGYPDCRPEFFKAFEEAARLGTKRGVEGKPIQIRVPLQTMTKADIVKEGARLRAPLQLTWSCYQGGEVSCGVCDSCVLRLKGFREAGLKDPVAYAKL